MDHTPLYLTMFRVETDDEHKGEYGSLAAAEKHATPEDYILEVTYREVRNQVIRQPLAIVKAEIKKSDWLLLTGEHGKEILLDASLIDLTQKQKKDPLAYKDDIYETHPEYIPFRSPEEITAITLHRGKYGIRRVGSAEDTTPWTIKNSLKDAKSHADKTWGLKVS